jgi:hypothetical protein
MHKNITMKPISVYNEYMLYQLLLRHYD